MKHYIIKLASGICKTVLGISLLGLMVLVLGVFSIISSVLVDTLVALAVIVIVFAGMFLIYLWATDSK